MEIPISQDIRKYKTKDVGNFSFKEAGYLALAIGAAILGYNLFGGSLEAAIIPMGLILVVGFIKPYGMSFIQFVRTVGREKLSPSTYIYETDFEYDMAEVEEMYGENNRVITEELIQSASANKISKYEEDLIIR